MNIILLASMLALLSVVTNNNIYAHWIDKATNIVHVRIPVPQNIPIEYSLVNGLLTFLFSLVVIWKVTKMEWPHAAPAPPAEREEYFPIEIPAPPEQTAVAGATQVPAPSQPSQLLAPQPQVPVPPQPQGATRELSTREMGTRELSTREMGTRELSTRERALLLAKERKEQQPRIPNQRIESY